MGRVLTWQNSTPQARNNLKWLLPFSGWQPPAKRVMRVANSEFRVTNVPCHYHPPSDTIFTSSRVNSLDIDSITRPDLKLSPFYCTISLRRRYTHLSTKHLLP